MVTKSTQPQNAVDLNDMPSMEELLGEISGEAQNSSFVEGTIIQARVAGKRDNELLLDIGYKAEGRVPRDEVSNWDEVEVGQELSVYLEQIEDEDSMPVLSVRRAEVQRAWDRLVTECEEGSIIKGVVKSRVKGGLIVDVGVEAFLPGSQVDLGPVRSLEEYLDQEFEFKVLKISSERRNIVLSRRELLEEARAEQRVALMTELEIGQLRKGVVKNITDFGAFVDLDGMDGLLHITDMSWGRVSHPSEVVEVNQELEVMILDVDKERQRVSLGLKQKDGNPWDTVDIKYPVDTRVSGRVVNVMPYGAFIELEEGIEGLIHVSEMSWTKKINRASDVLQIGDEVEAMILDVQKESHKISLGLRQCLPNPWEIIAEHFPKGTKIKGRVRNMTTYGAFVQIQDDIDGMIHVSDMSWTRKVNHPSEVLQKGEEVEAVILDIDPSQQRISLGMRQLMEDPWSQIETKYTVGATVTGKVSKLASFGAFVELADGIDGLIHISQLSSERVERVKDVVDVGDTIEAKVVRIDSDERRIGLSIRAMTDSSAGAQEDYFESDGDLKAAMSGLGSSEDGSTLGSLMENSVLDQLGSIDAAPATEAEESTAAEAEEAPATETTAPEAEEAPAPEAKEEPAADTEEEETKDAE